MSVHELYKISYVECVNIGGLVTAALLRWNDAVGSASWGFKHHCEYRLDDSEPDRCFVKVTAPRLSQHTVTRTPSGITVSPSILCPDCGLHGFVTNSIWRDA